MGKYSFFLLWQECLTEFLKNHKLNSLITEYLDGTLENIADGLKRQNFKYRLWEVCCVVEEKCICFQQVCVHGIC